MYVFRRGGSFYFEYSDEHRRIRRGGFQTKTLAKLAGDEDRRHRREQRGLVFPPVEQERANLDREGRNKSDEGDRDRVFERGRQAKVVDIREAMRARQRRTTEELR